MSSTENCKNGPVECESESDRRKIRAAQELERVARSGRGVQAIRRDEGMRAPLKDAPYAVSLRVSWLSSAGETTAENASSWGPHPEGRGPQLQYATVSVRR